MDFIQLKIRSSPARWPPHFGKRSFVYFSSQCRAGAGAGAGAGAWAPRADRRCRWLDLEPNFDTLIIIYSPSKLSQDVFSQDEGMGERRLIFEPI